MADIVRHLARLCLEIERGLRPVDQLTRFMDPGEALRFRGLLTLDRHGGGPVQPADLGPAHLTRHRDGTVFGTVVTRTEGRRWGALTLKFRERDGRWQIVDIRRLLAQTRTPMAREPVAQRDPMTISRSQSR